MKRCLRSIVRNKWTIVKPSSGKGVLVEMNSTPWNLIGNDFFSEFHECLDEIEQNYSEEAVILTSSKPGVFSQGIHREWFEELENSGDVICSNLTEIFERLYLLQQPTIAAISGNAFSGGCILALACDVRFMDWNYRLGLKAPVIGLPFVGAVYGIAMNELPHKLQKRFMYLGDSITTDEAISEGICFRNRHGCVEDALEFANAIVSEETFTKNKMAMKSGYRKWKEDVGNGIDEVFIEHAQSEKFNVALKEYLKNLTFTALSEEPQPTFFNY